MCQNLASPSSLTRLFLCFSVKHELLELFVISRQSLPHLWGRPAWGENNNISREEEDQMLQTLIF